MNKKLLKLLYRSFDDELSHSEQKQLDEISKAIGNSVNDIATDIQPSQEQKSEVRRGRGLRR